MSKNDDTFNEHGYKISNLEGKILTQLEASMPNDSQLTALKSVMRSLIWDWFYRDFGAVFIAVSEENQNVKHLPIK